MLKLFIYIIGIGVSLGLIGASIITSGHLSTTGDQLAQLELQKRELLLANQALEAQILSQSSLFEMQQKADSLGFVEATRVKSVVPPVQSVAYSP